ncbi:HIRAN domain-containing protein [Rhizorhabdus histidinilytica]|uniref:HIRAN domain-containing protein n=1 Tax=Rhizorhabdus histidinilytica TaxID=439228 RepID=UPI001F2FFD3C|nr:HIRAN domain-containing protein [Rhizorhabdus histidinilytica]
MPITTLSLLVKGADHRNKRGPTRRFEIAMCRPGEPVLLELEPKNDADPNAVMILSARGIQIGYVAAERAPWIGGMIRQGQEIRAIFQEATRAGAVIRITLDGSEPALPQPAAREPSREDADIGFWPDYIPPDD